MATATKESPISTSGSRSAYGYPPYQAGMSRDYKTAKPPMTSRQKPAAEPPFPSYTSVPPVRRSSHTRLASTRSTKGQVVILKAVAGGTISAIGQQPYSPSAEVGQPARPAPLPESAAKRAEAQKVVAKYKQLRDYLKCASTGERALITPKTAERAMKAWDKLWKASGYAMAAPAACTGPDGEMFYSWDRGRYHLELEIIPDEPAEFFYRDRETEQYWGEDYLIDDPLPAVVVATLGIFC